MLDDIAREDLVAWLQWLAAMGADAAVADTPTDWLERDARPPGDGFDWPSAAAQPAQPPPIQAQPRPPFDPAAHAVTQTPTHPPVAPRPAPALPASAPAARQFPTAAPDAAEMTARNSARSAKSLDELRDLLAGFDGCALKATAKNLCFYRGAPKSRLMIIGEAPGRDEDLEGKPFVGRAGQLLDKMLAAIGLDETQVHITNIVYWRPPGNRTPTPQEALVCRPFLERQADLVAPECVLLLGGAAAKAILGVEDGIMKLRGKWRDVTLGERTIPVIATLHPAYLLRTPASKRLAWRDLLALKARLQPTAKG